MADIIIPAKPGGYELGYSNGFFEVATINHVLSVNRQIVPCIAATTSPLQATYYNGISGIGATLTNNSAMTGFVLDDFVLAVNDRVIIKDEIEQMRNGIYVVVDPGSDVTNWVLQRATDYDAVSRMRLGDVVPNVKGTLNKGSLWMLVSNVTFIGVSDIVFVSVDNNSFTAINGTANQIKVDVNSGGVVQISIEENPVLPGTGGVTIPGGTVAQRPTSPALGTIRWTSDLP